jgi:hypothetical protein
VLFSTLVGDTVNMLPVGGEVHKSVGCGDDVSVGSKLRVCDGESEESVGCNVEDGATVAGLSRLGNSVEFVGCRVGVWV